MSYQIEFDVSTGRKITLEVGGHESVENLRDKLEPFVGVKIEDMKFFYNGQQVLIGHPFLEYNIEDGGSMMVVCDDDDHPVNVSGALNTGEFRANIYNGLLPQKKTVTYEKIFDEFSFQIEASSSERDIKLQKVAPICSFAKITNPMNKKEEMYMTVSLNTSMTKGSVRLSDLNILVLLDTSNSMLEPLSKKEGADATTKLAMSKETLLPSLLSSLNPENNFGIATYDDKLQVLQPISTVGSGIELVDVKEKVLSINPSETFDLRAGYDAAVEMIHPFASIEKENRIIVITDKIANHPNDLEILQAIRDAAAQRIYTTIIRVGKQLNKEVKKAITEIKGANLVEIESISEATKVADEFESYLIPLAFDLYVKVSSEDLFVEEVYGANFNSESGVLLNMPTLFPTLQDDNANTKGGIILLRLKPTGDTLAPHPTIQLSLSYESRDGEKQAQADNVDASLLAKELFGSSKIRKAISVALYVKTLISWVEEGVARAAATRGVKPPPREKDEEGEEVEEENQMTGKAGIPLKFTTSIADDFFSLRDYLLTEANKLMDPSIDKEVDVLSFLLGKIAQGRAYYEAQSESNTCFQHAINNYFQKDYLEPDFLSLYCELLRSSAPMITKLKNSGAKSSCYGSKLPNERFLHDSNSDPLYDEDLFTYFELYKAMQVDDFIQDITKEKFKELSPLQALFLLEFSMSILPSAGGGTKALLYYTPHTFLHRYSRNTSGRDQSLSQQRFCDAAKVAPKMFLCHIENGKSHAFAAINQIVPNIRSPSLHSSNEIPTCFRPAINLSGIPQTPYQTPASTPRPSTPTSSSLTPASTPRRDSSAGYGNTGYTPSTPSTSLDVNYGTNNGTLTPSPRDTTAIPFDLEIVSSPPPVPPSKSVWSTVFGFAFGPFASCVFPESCAPKYEEKNGESGVKTESMSVSDSKNGSPHTSKSSSNNSSKNNSGRNSPVQETMGEFAVMTSSTPPKIIISKQPDAEDLEWILLDSLVGTGLLVPDLRTMFNTYNYAGRASIAILPDTQREPILIGRKNIL